MIITDLDIIKKRKAIPKPHGTIILDDPALSNKVEFDTLQCGHCGKVWIPITGSKKHRGFCLKCHQVLCGDKQCMLICNSYKRYG